MDLPGTFQLVDIRPPRHFADYQLPSSENVNIGDLLGNPAYLTGAGPLIVLCRDGSLSMMVAGILSQKTERPIKAVYGGLEAYWNEAGPGAGARPVGGGAVPSLAPRIPATGRSAPAAGIPASTPRKKKSAGC
jgi:rhodanese-related sulfurtransferase